MLNVQNKKCPYFQEQCLTDKCAMWDKTLTNCVIKLTPYFFSSKMSFYTYRKN